MAGSLSQLFARNWPIKLAAVFFAVMLYVAVAAQQPITQTLALRLEIEGPPGRPIRQAPGDVAVLISGKVGELLKLRALPTSSPGPSPTLFRARCGTGACSHRTYP